MEDNQDNKALAESMGYKLVDDAEKNESTESVDTESSLKQNLNLVTLILFCVRKVKVSLKVMRL